MAARLSPAVKTWAGRAAAGVLVLAAIFGTKACADKNARNRIDELKAQQKEYIDSLAAANNAVVNQLNERIDVANARADAYSDEVSELQDSLDAVSARADSIQARIDKCCAQRRRAATTKPKPAPKKVTPKPDTVVCVLQQYVPTVCEGVEINGDKNVVRGNDGRSVSIVGDGNIVDMTPPRDTVHVKMNVKRTSKCIVTVTRGRTR